MFKPKCYKEFNPKDYGKTGKKHCLGEVDYVKKDIEEKCKKCKWHKQR